MKKELHNIHNNNYLTVEYLENLNYIYCNWIGFISKGNLIKGVQAYLEVLEKSKCPFFLNNNQEVLGPCGNIDKKFEEFTKTAKALGLKHMAHVQAPKIAAALAGQSLHKIVNNTFELRIFGEFDSAKLWLLQMQRN